MTQSLEQEIRELRSLLGSPRDPEGRAFAPLADAYRRAGDFRLAVELLREGIERHPDFVAGHIVAAQLYLEKGLLEEAEIAARRAVELDEENAVAWGLLAGALEARGAMAQARDARARLLDLEGIAQPEEPGLDVAALAPAESVFEAEALAPDEPVLDVTVLAPDEAVLDVAALAPDEAVLEAQALAPDEAVLDVAALAPDEAVLEVEALAPDEPVVDVAAPALKEPVPPAGDLPSDELPESEPLVTRTMAELYARQGLTDRALLVYRQLLEVSPGDDDLRRRVQELEGRRAPPEQEPDGETFHAEHAWTGAAAECHDEVETPFAWTDPPEPQEPPAPVVSARAYFRRMLEWGAGVTKGDA